MTRTSRAAIAVAHRGDPYHHRENTLPSLRSAARAGADAAEMDVRLTRDGTPVLLHDPTLKRLWERRVPVADLTSAQLDRLTDGSVPTLHEGLSAVDGARAMLDLTIAEAAAATVAAVRDGGTEDRVYYCGALAGLLAVRDLDPDAEIALTWTSATPPPPLLLDELRPRWLNVPFGLVDAPLVRWAHEHGLLLGAWTADLRRTMARLLALGADAVTTNRIDCLRRLLDGRPDGPLVRAAGSTTRPRRGAPDT